MNSALHAALFVACSAYKHVSTLLHTWPLYEGTLPSCDLNVMSNSCL